MVAINNIHNDNKINIDFSFIPSLECDIECPFCMYDAGPDKTEILDINTTRSFLKSIDWGMINSCGLYGGEPSINLPLYKEFYDLIPVNTPKFMITNGSWSTDTQACLDFLKFMDDNPCHLVVSGTPYHKIFQNKMVLKEMKKGCPDGIRLKGDDIIHPMGRASKKNWTCNYKCQRFNVPIRLGLFPNGDILFQNCDGVYPVVQTYHETFDINNVYKAIRKCNERD